MHEKIVFESVLKFYKESLILQCACLASTCTSRQQQKINGLRSSLCRSSKGKIVKPIKWAYSTRPVFGWGDSISKQKATAGWLAALPVFEPHWQICMASGLSSGSDILSFLGALSLMKRKRKALVFYSAYPGKYYHVQTPKLQELVMQAGLNGVIANSSFKMSLHMQKRIGGERFLRNGFGLVSPTNMFIFCSMFVIPAIHYELLVMIKFKVWVKVWYTMQLGIALHIFWLLCQVQIHLRCARESRREYFKDLKENCGLKEM